MLTIHSLDSAEHGVFETVGKDTGHHDKGRKERVCRQKLANLVIMVPKEVQVGHEPGKHLGWVGRLGALS
jgi:hypothetical protein